MKKVLVELLLKSPAFVYVEGIRPYTFGTHRSIPNHYRELNFSQLFFFKSTSIEGTKAALINRKKEILMRITKSSSMIRVKL